MENKHYLISYRIHDSLLVPNNCSYNKVNKEIYNKIEMIRYEIDDDIWENILYTIIDNLKNEIDG